MTTRLGGEATSHKDGEITHTITVNNILKNESVYQGWQKINENNKQMKMKTKTKTMIMKTKKKTQRK